MSSGKEVKDFYRKYPFPSEDIRSREQLERHKWIIKSIPVDYKLTENLRIADIGCGTGDISCYLSKFGKIDGYDFSDTSIKKAKEFSKKLNIKNVNFIKDDITKNKPRKVYDLIFSIGVIHHIPEQAKAIQNIKKMMNKDSLFIVGIYNRYANMLWKLKVSKANLNRYNDAFKHPYEKFYGKEEYKKILESSGFEIVKIYKDIPDIFRFLTGRGRIVTYCVKLK